MNTIAKGMCVLFVLDTTPGGSIADLRERFNALTSLAVRWQDGAWQGGQKTIVIYPSLYSLFLQGVQNKTLPSQTLADWRILAETLLAQYRKHRATTFLLESDAVMQAADAVQTRLVAWVGADDLPGSVPPAAASVVEDASCRLLCTHALLSSRMLRRLSDELAAGGFALRRAPDDAPEALDAVFALRSQCNDARAAQDKAAQQATTYEAALAVANTRIAAQEKELCSLSDRAALVPGLEQKTATLQELLEEEFIANKAQQAAANSVHTEEKRHLERQISDLTAALAKERKTAAEMDAELQKLMTKHTAQMRDAARLASDNEVGILNQTALAAERDQVRAVHKAKTLIFQAEAEELRRLLAEREQTIAGQTAMLHDQAEALRLHQIALDEIKRSRSWKITQPLRTFRGSFGRRQDAYE